MTKINNIDDYIDQFPPTIQTVLMNIRKQIIATTDGLEEAMAYGIPTFRYKGENLVHFAGFERHIGFYPTPSGIKAFKNEIKDYKWAKGSVQFQLDKPIPYELIRKITSFRISEIDNK